MLIEELKMKIKEEEIKKYYSGPDFNPEMPDMPNFRHYRFKLYNGIFRKVPEKIKTKTDLIKWIIRLNGCDIYYSTSKWMNPHKISTKGHSGTYFIADNLNIGYDLVFDIDGDEPITMKSLDLARKSASNIYESMKQFKDKYRFKYFAFSGFKGFRLAYNDLTELPKNPKERLDVLEKNRKIFIGQLLDILKNSQSIGKIYKIETKFDKKITENIMCVVRVIGTAHSTTGYISTKLQITELKKPIQEVLKHIPYIGKMRPVIPVKGEMKVNGDQETASPHPRLLQSANDVSGLASLSYRYFITNRVLGVKGGFIPIFIYQENQKYYKKELRKLSFKHYLGPIYIFKFDKSIIALSLKVMQARQLQKVLNKSSSRTKHAFRKYKRIYSPFTLNLEETFGETLILKGQISKGHFNYVFMESNNYPEGAVGWENVELIRADKKDPNMDNRVNKNN